MTESAYGNSHRRQEPYGKGSYRMRVEEGTWGRQTRFSGLKGLMKACDTEIGIIGVGAIGHQVAVGLATMGFKKLTIIDPDIVSSANLGTQGYRWDQIGQRKIDATEKDCKALQKDMVIVKHHGRYGNKKRIGDDHVAPPEGGFNVLFLCPDDMVSRNDVWSDQQLRPRDLIIDTRMGAFGGRVIVDHGDFSNKWKPSLFSDSAAFAGTCTLQSTYFTANIVSGFAIASMMTYFAAGGGGSPFDPLDFIVDMLDMDITHQTEPMGTATEQLQGNVNILKVSGPSGFGAQISTGKHQIERAKDQVVKDPDQVPIHTKKITKKRLTKKRLTKKKVAKK